MERARLLRFLEIAVFVVVFGAGTVLTAVAVQEPEQEPAGPGGSGGIQLFPGGSRTATNPPTSPTNTAPAESSPLTLPPGAEPTRVRFIDSRSNGVADGCVGHLSFYWEADPATSPPEGSPGLIELTGPSKAGRYTRPFSGDRLEFDIDVPLGGDLRSWKAIVISVGGRPTDSVQLGWSFPPCRA